MRYLGQGWRRDLRHQHRILSIPTCALPQKPLGQLFKLVLALAINNGVFVGPAVFATLLTLIHALQCNPTRSNGAMEARVDIYHLNGIASYPGSCLPSFHGVARGSAMPYGSLIESCRICFSIKYTFNPHSCFKQSRLLLSSPLGFLFLLFRFFAIVAVASPSRRPALLAMVALLPSRHGSILQVLR